MSELTKDQMDNIKKGQLEFTICDDYANAFAQLMGRGIWLFHDTTKAVYNLIKNENTKKKFAKFDDEAWKLQNDKSVTNVRLKNATIIKLWIEGIALCFKEMKDDYDTLRKVFGIDTTYAAVDEISLTGHRGLADLVKRIRTQLKEEYAHTQIPFQSYELLCYAEDRMEEVDKASDKYKTNSVMYNLILVKNIIEILCSWFIYVEDKND